MQSFLSFSGRTSRKTCWISGLAIVTAAVVAWLLIGLGMRAANLLAHPWANEMWLTPSIIVLLALFPLYARRLHDRDRSALWLVAGPLLVLSFVVILPVLDSLITPNGTSPWPIRSPTAAALEALAGVTAGAPMAWMQHVPDCYTIATTTSVASERYLFGSLGIVTLLFGLWLIVELAFWPGTAGPNRYGPDPGCVKRPMQL